MPGWLERLRGGRRASAAVEPAKAASLATLLAEGNRLLELGNPADAEMRYAEAWHRYPAAAAAVINLAYARLAQGNLEGATEALNHALVLEPNNVDALMMLGTIALDCGEVPTAIERLQAVLRVCPGFLPAHAPLARSLAVEGDLDAARQVVDAGLALEPRHGELHFLKGNLLRVAGTTEAAIGAYRAALEAEPRLLEARVALATLLIDTGEFAAARGHLDQSMAQHPPTPKLCTQVGDSFLALGAVDAACSAYGMALQLDSAHGAALQNLNIAESLRGRLDAAREAAQRLTEVAPERVEGWQNLGATLEELGHLGEAEGCLRRAFALSPGDARTQTMLATLALRRGDTAGALAGFERALSIDPDSAKTLSHYLFALSYVDDPERYLDAARAYGRLVTAQARPYSDWPAITRDPAALRVGIVSGDLRAHPIGYFIEGVLPHLRSQGIEVLAFPTGAHNDPVTLRLQSHCNRWVPLPGLSDSAAAASIREEGVHVLLDLDGHGGRSRLPVFAWRPAPVQASWLGYWASTGVPAMDYVIADPLSAPEDQHDRYTEKVWWLPETRLCFTAPAESSELPVLPPPAKANGHVTFGSFQNLSKIGDPVLAAWRRVLDAVPGSRLRLQSKQTDAEGAERVRRRLVDAGIGPARLVLAAPSQRLQYLAAYCEVDVVLDSFPFPGGTTTCEALWMGVPTVTMIGRSMVANQGRLILTNAGLPEWVAKNVDEYVSIAARQAADLDALTRLRAELRTQVLASPLFDARRFSGHLAKALRDMWSQRCPA